jgi:hypothetical protein
MSGTSFTGNGVNLFAAATIRSALKLYANTGMRANRAYTPKAMLEAAGRITGRTFKRGEYLVAAAALQELIDAQVPAAVASGEIRNF